MITLNLTTNTLTIKSKIFIPRFDLVSFKLEVTDGEETNIYSYYSFCNDISDVYKLDAGVISNPTKHRYTYKLRCENEMEVGILKLTV